MQINVENNCSYDDDTCLSAAQSRVYDVTESLTVEFGPLEFLQKLSSYS
jgi:hypothetical protein